MDDLSDDPRRMSVQRVEVYAGSGRRRWPDDVKAQIVAESISPGAVVTQVARRHGCRPQQVHEWRAQARAGRLILPAPANAPALVPLVAEPPAASAAASITVDIAEASVRVSGRPGVAELIDVFIAVRKAHSC